MTENVPTQRSNQSNQIDLFLKQMSAQKSAAHGRLIFALDATASRQKTWDKACQLQSEMFAEAARIGGLEVQLVFYRGDECRHSGWTTSPHELGERMRRITCKGGVTQIIRVLKHIGSEHRQKPVSAAIFVGDAMEGDTPGAIQDAGAGLGVPLFIFQEGDDRKVKEVFRELACLTGGAYAKFAPGAGRELGDMLRAVAAYAAGGRKALESQNTNGARKLLGQLKEK